MGKKDPAVTAYVANAADFAKPILKHVRKVVHDTCPDVSEEIKWSFPNFLYKGMFCSMASFKEHASFGFWKGALIAEKFNDVLETPEVAMGQFGRITKLDDLPSDDVLVACIKEAMRLNDENIKSPARAKKLSDGKVVLPNELESALKTNKIAAKQFENLSPSHRREYAAWIADAKTDATREKRLATAIEWISEGKSQNWRYERNAEKKPKRSAK